MGSTNERVDVKTSVAVRGESGFHFGTLRWIEGERLLIEVDADLIPGEDLDVRVTLAPTAATALFRARANRPLVTAKGETPRYILTVLSVNPGDRETYETWLRNVKTRGTFSSFDTVLTSPRSGGSAHSRPSADVSAALKRLADKGSASHPPDPFRAGSQLSTGSGDLLGGGRSGVRDALRGAIARTARTGAVPMSPQGGAPATVPPRTEPSVPVASAPRAPGSPDPSYATAQTRSATWLELRWHSSQLFARDSEQQLCNYMIVVARGATPLPEREPVRIMLRHEDVQIECDASVRAYGPQNVSYRLQLDALQIERLRTWALNYGKK